MTHENRKHDTKICLFSCFEDILYVNLYIKYRLKKRRVTDGVAGGVRMGDEGGCPLSILNHFECVVSASSMNTHIFRCSVCRVDLCSDDPHSVFFHEEKSKRCAVCASCHLLHVTQEHAAARDGCPGCQCAYGTCNRWQELRRYPKNVLPMIVARAFTMRRLILQSREMTMRINQEVTTNELTCQLNQQSDGAREVLRARA